ncbi:MAG: metallophosphoesterase [Coriobacteriales bacterium]|jgi:calcineurin-like phosphoesterase family protein
MALYFTSDLHLGHEAIIEMNARPFASVEEMNAALIDNINETVSANDTLFILGDFSYRIRRDESVELAERIACRNIHLVKGNHDKDFSKFGVFKSIRDYRELRYGEEKRRFVLFHYPIASWAGMRGGSIHLHGHIHTGGDNLNKSNFANGFFRYDVGVDANGYKPVHIDRILELAHAFER